MEVHKHPHHVTHKKKWTEYLLEFFMLFLAVFLGFVAENVRENVVERQREKEYIESLVQDLTTDTTNLTNVIRVYEKQSKRQDSLLQVFDSIDKGFNNDFFKFSGSVLGFPDFVYTDATIQQLKSSGGFRLIRNKKAVDSINAYTSAVSKTSINTDELGKSLHELSTNYYSFINFRGIKKAMEPAGATQPLQLKKIDVLISHKKEDLDKFYGQISAFQQLMQIICEGNFIPLKQRASNLINLLQKEYHLEKE